MPFLGPAIAAWITLSVGVMACYYLFIVPRGRVEDRAARPSVSSTRWLDSRPPPVRPVPRVNPVPRAAPWSATAPSVASRALEPKPDGSGLPRYDMEDFPAEQWGRAAG
jgi:hypothetical protein